MNRRFLISRVLFPTAIAVVVSYFLLSQISIRSIPETLGRMPLRSLVVGFGLYCLFVWTKALRFRELLRLGRPIRQLLPILALHTFWGNILPMRGGDVSYIYLMKRREQVDGAKSVASLMLASLLDLTLLIALMVGTGWMLRPPSFPPNIGGEGGGQLSYIALYLMPILIGVLLIGLMTIASLAPKACIAIAETCARPLLCLNQPLVLWLTHKCLEVVHELTQFHLDRRFFTVWGYSIVSLGVRFGFQCYLVREMGVAVSVVSLLFALAFTNLFNLLPIQSVGNFGTIEAPFAWALMRFGTSKENALVSGFSLHLIILLYCLPLGVYGFFRRKRAEK